MKEYILPLIILILLTRSCFYEPFRVQSKSMEPQFKAGEMVVAKKYGYGTYGTFGITFLNTVPWVDLHRGEVVFFVPPGKDDTIWLKRLIGLPGDTLRFENENLFVNGEAVPTVLVSKEKDSLRYQQTTDGITFEVLLNNSDYRRSSTKANGEWMVPADHVFLAGDNRDLSHDSRYLGAIPLKNIVGVAF